MKALRMIALFISLSMTIGCAGNPALVKSEGADSRDDVFREIAPVVPAPKGYARLDVASSLKVLKLGDKGSSAGMALVLDIDGQVVRIPSVAKEENRESLALRDPEAGSGIRHSFAAHLQLRAGTHRLIAAIPEKGIAVEEEITLADGTENVLQLAPRYRGTPPSHPTVYNAASFREGMIGIEARLNGKPI